MPEITRSFGRRSSELAQWAKMIRGLEGSERGFYLLREVRNYLHSRSVPIAANVSSELAESGRAVTVVLRLDETELRKDRKLNEFLNDNPSLLTTGLDVLPLVESMQRAVEELKLFRLQIEYPEARDAGDVLRRVTEEVFASGDPVYSWPIVFSVDGEPGEDGWRMDNLSFLPIDLLAYLPDSPSFSRALIPGARGEEHVGPHSVRMRRSYVSFSTKVVLHGRDGSVAGDAHVWSNRAGPGWGATVFLEGHCAPGSVLLETQEGHRARAILDSFNFHGSGDTVMMVGVLVGQGAPPPDSQVTHPYRTPDRRF